MISLDLSQLMATVNAVLPVFMPVIALVGGLSLAGAIARFLLGSLRNIL